MILRKSTFSLSEATWRRLGDHLGHLGAPVGPLGRPSWSSPAPLGLNLEPLGHLLGPTWAQLGASWAPFGSNLGSLGLRDCAPCAFQGSPRVIQSRKKLSFALDLRLLYLDKCCSVLQGSLALQAAGAIKTSGTSCNAI